MAALDKKSLSERDICTKFIHPALEQASWDLQVQVREEVTFYMRTPPLAGGI